MAEIVAVTAAMCFALAAARANRETPVPGDPEDTEGVVVGFGGPT